MKMTVSMLSGAPRVSRSLGGILIDSGLLKQEDAERVLMVQKEHNLRFGDAAIRLGPADRSRHPVRAVAPVRLRLPAQVHRRQEAG